MSDAEREARRKRVAGSICIPDEDGDEVEVRVVHAFGAPCVNVEVRQGGDLCIGRLSEAGVRLLIEALESKLAEIRRWRGESDKRGKP